MKSNLQATKNKRRITFILSFFIAFAVLPLFTPGLTKTSKLPRPDHVVIVFEENKGYEEIVDSPSAAYINSLITQGASLTSFHSLHHPSQPNYIDFFSGSDQGVFSDNCPPPQSPYSAPSLAGILAAKSLTFTGYIDNMPKDPSTCDADRPYKSYSRRHAPWVNFKDSASSGKNFADFANDMNNGRLPTVALVIPDLAHDMHNAPDKKEYPMCFKNTFRTLFDRKSRIKSEVCAGDTWLKTNLDVYVKWAKTHNSLLIVTWDENSESYSYPSHPLEKIITKPPENRIATIFIGPMVKSGATNATVYNHHDLLRTIEEMYGLPLLEGGKNAKVVTGIWKE
jgi:acid phosphatase